MRALFTFKVPYRDALRQSVSQEHRLVAPRSPIDTIAIETASAHLASLCSLNPDKEQDDHNNAE